MTSITLPPEIYSIVEAETREGGFATPSDYLSDLVKRDQMLHSDEILEALALEGLDSGEFTEMTAASWRELRMELHRQAGIT